MQSVMRSGYILPDITPSIATFLQLPRDSSDIENPELATERTRVLYKAKGYPDDWIEKRLRGIAVREELTAEWEKRGIEQERDYAILAAEISKATFGMNPSDYKKHKGLKQENLRDHMSSLELIFSMLGEASTKEIALQSAQCPSSKP